MIWKVLTGVLGVLLLATNALHIYWAVDRGVTQMYREQVIYELSNRFVNAAKLAEVCVKGKTEEQSIALLKQVFPGEEPFTKEGAVHTTWISLKLAPSGRVQGIETEGATEWARPAADPQ